MIKKETRKALSALVGSMEVWRIWRKYTDREEQAIYKIYDEAEKFVQAFRKHELKIDD
ncbi:MAG: hypothetical protein IKI76_04455 [Selenomonadaceae bacterium]|nr:hypothetical protein [Selenomonadaceae bacterium]